MEKKFNRTLVTSALPYANGGVHIGHLAGVYVPADIYVRYLRLKKQEVLFIGGSDEHGVPVTIRARKEGITTQEVVDRYHNLIKKSFEDFGISFDIYSRTTSKIHNKFASDFFRTLYDNNKLVEKTEEQFCDEVTGEFLTDRNIVGTCPRCGAEGAYGDQCEKCGATLSPEELINPTNKNNPGHGLVKKATKNWYLPLNDYQDWLKQWILEEHKEWRPNVYGQCKSWLDMDLQPRAMTRDLDWGIPVPVEGAEGKVLYVWFDAPIGYISNTKELCDAQTEKWGTWQKWWQDPSTRLVHFIGKDNIVFHCIVFPTMLKAHAAISCPTTCLPMSSSIWRTTKFPHHATGPSGSTNIWKTSLASKTFCAMCSRPTLQKRKTTTSPGRISKTATTTNWWLFTATSSTVRSSSRRNISMVLFLNVANCLTSTATPLRNSRT